MHRFRAIALCCAAGLASVLTPTSLPKAQTAGWTLGPPMPGIRTEPGADAIGTRIYVVGGSTREIDTLTSGLVLDAAGKEGWKPIAAMPSGLNHIATAVLGGRLYTMGGFAGRAPGETGSRLHQGATSHVFRYDPAADAWETLAPLPTGRGAVGAAVIDGKIHVVGGRKVDMATVTEHDVYDPATNKWTQAAPLPRAKDHLFAVAARGKLPVIGGRYDSRDENASDHDIYDPVSNSWSSGPPLPTPRSGGQSGLVGNRIMVFGGENSKKTFDELEAFNLDTGQWEILSRGPSGLHASAGAVVGDAIYFPGGSTGPGGDSITAQVMVFRGPPAH